MRSYILYLTDVAGALAKIEEFTAGMTYDEFCRDDKTQSAVIRKFEIIGEAAKQIPLPVRERLSSHSPAGNGRNAGQTDSYVFWHRYGTRLADSP